MRPGIEVEIRVHYPLARGSMTLRADTGWKKDIEPYAASADGTRFEFRLLLRRPYLYFKPVIHDGGEIHWAVGSNYLVLADAGRPRDVYPYFFAESACSVCDLRELEPRQVRTRHGYRVFSPPGYQENTLKRYPVLYMHDGQNLFFPEEAFQGHHWRVEETLSILSNMNAIDKVIVVGIYPNQREREYTRPGYETYARFLVEELKPAVDAEYRTLEGPAHTAVMGSSLGGVVSLYLAWEHPRVFGMAAAMSSPFGWRDDLRERVASEPKRPLRLYLDSGWPHDNYELTRDMRELLLGRGFTEGTDLLYFAFPEALHNEQFWALRSHIPFQFFFGRVPRSARHGPRG